MNNKGFTLIELLATIVLLAVIATISFVSITTAINKGKVNSCKEIQDSIKSAMTEYVSANRYKSYFTTTGYTASPRKKTVTAEDLINGHYLSEITNPFDNTLVTIPGNISVVAYLNDDNTVKSISISSSTYGWIVNCN